MLRIVHLVDDTGPGGVTRYLDFLKRDPEMARFGQHDIVPVPRNRPASIPVEGDVIVSHLAVTWRGLPGLMALRARHAGTPLIHVEHSYSAGFAAHNVTARRRFHALLRSAYALFDRVVAVSEAQGAWLTARGLVAPGALAVIPPCVALAPFRALPAPQAPVRVLGAIGRFDRQKGFDQLIAALRAAPEARIELRMIGDGPERTALEAQAAGDPRIRFTGFAGDPVAAMAGVDAVAMPSRWEPYGLVALEARAAGRPLLVSGQDGLSDHGKAGALVLREPGTDGWSRAIAALAAGELSILGTARAPEAEARCRAGWAALLGAGRGHGAPSARRVA